MKKISIIFFAAALLLTGCYQDKINELQSEVKKIKEVELAQLDSQVDSITATLSTLDKLSKELSGYIDELKVTRDALQKSITEMNSHLASMEAEVQSEISGTKTATLAQINAAKSSMETKLNAINATISVLTKKDSEINTKIAELRTYADSKLATQDWVNGTIATLTSQNALVDDVKLVNAQVEALAETIRIAEKDVTTHLQNAMAAEDKDLSEKLAAKVKQLNTMISESVSTTQTTLLAKCAGKLQDAISASETKLKGWVSDQLGDYFTVAEAQAKLLAFNNLVGAVPSGKNVQEEIDALVAELEKLKTEITAAYTAAIKAAADASLAKEQQAVLDKINALKTDVIAPLQTRVTKLETELATLWENLGAVTGRVNTAEEQVTAINTSIAVLDRLGKTLKEYIEGIKAEMKQIDKDKFDSVKGYIDALQELATGTGANSLQSQINALKAIVGEIPSGQTNVVDWVKSCDRTIREKYSVCCTIESVAALQKEINDLLADHAGRIEAVNSELSTKIVDSRETIEGWITKQLTDGGYITASQMNAKIKVDSLALCSLIDGGDADVQQKITTLQTDISSAIESFTAEYIAAIKQAIEDNDGYVTEQIQNAVDALDTKISTLQGRVDAIDADLVTIKADVATIKSDVGQLTTDIAALQKMVDESGIDGLQQFVDYLNEELGKCPDKYATIQQLTELKNTVDALKVWTAKLTDLTGRITTLEGQAGDLSSFLSGLDLKEGGLVELMTGINTSLNSLWDEVFGTTAKDGLQKQIDAILKELYGDSMKPEGASDDSIYGRVQALSGRIVGSSFSSISYIPTNADGAAEVNSGNKAGSLTFVVRPAKLVSILTDDNCKMMFVETPKLTKSAPIIYECSSSRITVRNETEGTITVTATFTNYHYSISSDRPGNAVLYVDARKEGKESEDEKVTFTSAYIPLKLN